MSGSSEATERKAFKDYFDRAAVRMLAKQIKRVSKSFDDVRFVRNATRKLDTLELAARVKQLSDELAAALPADRVQALAILAKSLPPVMPNCEQPTDGWLQWPVGQFIADHGIDHFDPSMEAMIELTQRFTSEFAVRPFVELQPNKTFARLQSLTGHESPHVRRWCSEGCRPRLPWGKKLRALVDDPSPIWPILEALKDDPELYVRRSVANNLNDIAKDHEEAVVQRCRQWSKRSTAERDWLIKHGLRSLVKAGHPGALEVLGFGKPKGLSATLKATPKKIAIGDSVRLQAILRTTATKKQGLVIDYVVHYVRKGNKSSAKVFKWKQTEMAVRGELLLEKKHPMRVTTIRALYPGRHRVELQVNGACVAETSFNLVG